MLWTQALTRRRLALTPFVVASSLALPSCVAPPPAGDAGRRPDASLAAARVRSLDGAKPVESSWGWIRWLMSAEIEPGSEMTFGVVRLEAGQRNPPHAHHECEEHLYVISGSCEHRVGDEWVALREGDLLRIPRGVPHAARTLAEPMTAVIVYSSGTRDFVAVDDPPERAPDRD